MWQDQELTEDGAFTTKKMKKILYMSNDTHVHINKTKFWKVSVLKQVVSVRTTTLLEMLSL